MFYLLLVEEKGFCHGFRLVRFVGGEQVFLGFFVASIYLPRKDGIK